MAYHEDLNLLAEQRWNGRKSVATPRSAAGVATWKRSIIHSVRANIGIESNALSPETWFERALNRNDLVDVLFFDRMRDVAKAVGRIGVKNGYGTGWLLNSGLLITNNHVLPDVNSAAEAVVVMGHDLPSSETRSFRFDPRRFFITSAKDKLDYTIVALKQDDEHALRAFGFLTLAAEEVPLVALGEPLNIIQHPNGEHKQFAVRENELVAAYPEFLHYRTDTNPGSSGSPVFDTSWRVVALHHSGVPRKVNGKVVTRSGDIWQSSMSENTIDWIANEGVRIDAILKDVRRRIEDNQKRLFGTILQFKENSEFHIDLRGPSKEIRDPDEPAKEPREMEPNNMRTPQHSPLATDVDRKPSAHPRTPTTVTVVSRTPIQPVAVGQSITIPLQIDVTVGVSSTPPRSEGRGGGALGQALEYLARLDPQTYYDKRSDEFHRDAYYRQFKRDNEPSVLREQLTNLLESTHMQTNDDSWTRIAYLWGRVDVVRNGRKFFLRSIYSGEEYHDVMGFMREAFRAAEAMADLQSRKSSMTPEAFMLETAALEADVKYAHEHIVPADWFGAKMPMLSDLHHLFTCDSKSIALRSGLPFGDFADYPERNATGEGKVEDGRFEPRVGKGAIARATLYFLVRYPGMVAGRYSRSELGMLRRWSEADPPDEWELHRNAEIAAIQGNRNPFIDDPDLVRRVDFIGAL